MIKDTTRWINFFGKELYKTIETHYSSSISNNYFKDFISIDDMYDQLQQSICDNGWKINANVCDNVAFWEFYKGVVCYAIKRFDLTNVSNNSYLRTTVGECLGKAIMHDMHNICARSLIFLMHRYKREGKLMGSTPKAEYEYYNNKIINTKNFFCELLEQFPELIRLSINMIDQTITFWTEIIDYFVSDKNKIIETFGYKDVNIVITHIEPVGGDKHHKGRQVMKISLSNGKEILYKPRSMENENVYFNLMEWLSEKTGIGQLRYKFVSCKEHSWSEIVQRQFCVNESERKLYYERMGLHLFLVWLLGVKDIHCENLIAVGEFPVIVDLEVLMCPGKNIQKTDLVIDAVHEEIQNSVLMSGILPYMHWNRDGDGIDCSALTGSGGQHVPFQITVIENNKTSDMKISYMNPQTTYAHNLPDNQKGVINPSKYENELIHGMNVGFLAVSNYKTEFMIVLQQLKKVRSRFLATDTQRYSMLIKSSYHPSLLTSVYDRETFLHAIWKNRDESEEKIIETEIRSLSNGDIPIFYIEADGLNIYDQDNHIVDTFLGGSAYEKLLKKIEHLSKKDIQKQYDVIAVALKMKDQDEKLYVNHNKMLTMSENSNRYNVNDVIKHLYEKIKNTAIWNANRTEVSWYTSCISNKTETAWTLLPLDKYLYDGLSGMTLIFYMISICTDNREDYEYFETLKNGMFTYTDNVFCDREKCDTKKTGMFDGEGSIVYTYLILYSKKKEIIYLEYAKKHATILMSILEEDERYDLLSGNAGAAMVLLLLYQQTKDELYLEYAKKAIEHIVAVAEVQEEGIGWIAEESGGALSGMAHGNSGFLMPVFWLWTITQENYYRDLAEMIWRYENSLYDETINNWRDLRDVDNSSGESAIAWCHGAPGIMLSRVFCYELTEDYFWKQRFLSEIKKGYEKLKEGWIRDSWCLCHGNAGNLIILKKVEKLLNKLNNKKNKEYIHIKQNYLKCGFRLLPQELLNPGLMNGYGGILLFCMVLND